jgi:hypothetical protein
MKEADMFYHDWILAQLAQERRRDLVRQLEQDRLVRLADPVRPQRVHTIYHALDLVGRQLIVLGEHLRARHAVSHARALLHSSRGQS